MRRATIAMLALVTIAVAGCGGGSHFADKSRPPTPVNVTVYIDNSRLLLSPSTVGAGPVVFTITNQATRAQSVTIRATDGGNELANTAPLNPQATSQVKVSFHAGDYELTTRSVSSATSVLRATTEPASLHIGNSRANSNTALLER